MRVVSIGSNMRELRTKEFIILFSYATPVAYEDRKTDRVYVTDKKFSVTTSRHINKWVMGRDSEPVPQAQIEALVPL